VAHGTRGLPDLRCPAMLARPGREAARLDHSYIGSDHYLLALLATPSIASETLEELGITYERVVESVRGRETHIAARSDEEPQRRELSPTPDAYGLMGRAEAFAATAGDRRPRPEHWLLAIVWSSTGSSVTTLHHLGAPQPAVLDGLRRRGVPVPEVEPPLYRPWRGGGEVEVSEEELQPLLDVLRQMHPPGSEWRWGFNWTRDEPRRARVVAEDEIDLEAALRESRHRTG
jgi:Clp amino terminal domain, pathogenicity island component